MTRRLFLWLAVTAWIGFGLTGAVTAAASLSGWGIGGWTFYTPYTPYPPPAPAERIVNACTSAQVVLLPVAAVSLAVYLVLLDRDVRRGSPRGFEVDPAPD